MSLEAALQAIESDEERERERAIPHLVACEAPEALVALEKVANHDDNLQLRFMAKEGARKLRQRLSGTTRKIAVQNKGQLDLTHLRSRLEDPEPKRRLRGVRSALATKDRRALPLLQGLLKQERDEKVVVELCMTVGVLGGKGDGDQLLTRLRDPSPAIREAAIRGLAYLRDRSVYPTLVAMLQDRQRAVRARAFEALTRLGKPRLIRLLVRMLGSSKEWPRKAAVRACARINSPECAELLIPVRAQDPSDRIRREATKALVNLSRKGNRVAAAAIAKAPPDELERPLASTDGLVIDRADQGAVLDPAQAEIARLKAEVERAKAEAEAAKAAAAAAQGEPAPAPAAPPAPTPVPLDLPGALDPAPAGPGLGAGSSSVSGNLPQPPLELLQFDDDDDPDQSELEDLELSTAEMMIDGLNDPDPATRLNQVGEILAQRDRSMAPQLAARIQLEEDPKVIAKLILALGKLGRKKDARRLLRFLDSSDKRLRANAVEALSMLGEESALKSCVPLLEDEDNRVRANAVVALQRVEGVDVIAVLKQMAKHPDIDMRFSAIFAALEIGTTEVDPILDFLFRDAEQEVKDKALTAKTLLEDQRMAPLHGFDPDNSQARMEKISAWRGGAVEDEDEEVETGSASLDEEAEKLLEKLSDDASMSESRSGDAQAEPKSKGNQWGRMPKSAIKKDEAPKGPSLQERIMTWLTDPNASKPEKSGGGGGEDIERRNVLVVGGITVLVVMLLYLTLFGGEGGGGFEEEF